MPEKLKPTNYQDLSREIVDQIQAITDPEAVTTIIGFLEGDKRKSKISAHEPDNLLYHALRINSFFCETESHDKQLEPYVEMGRISNDTKKLIPVALLLHDLMDPKHAQKALKATDIFSASQTNEPRNDWESTFSRIRTLTQQIQKSQEPLESQIRTILDLEGNLRRIAIRLLDFLDITQGTYQRKQLERILVGMQMTEIIGERARPQNISPQENTGFVLPSIGDLQNILFLIARYGHLPVLIKAVEKLDNLRHPVPSDKTSDKEAPSKPMIQDAIEAYFLFIPYLETIGLYNLRNKLKEVTVPILFPEEIGQKLETLNTAYREIYDKAKKIIVAMQDSVTDLASAPNVLVVMNTHEVKHWPNYGQDNVIFDLSPAQQNAIQNHIATRWGTTTPNPWLWWRIKGFGSALEKVIRYLKYLKDPHTARKLSENSQVNSDQSPVQILENLPDLLGFKMAIPQSVYERIVENIEHLKEIIMPSNQYRHPLGKTPVEVISTSRGYQAIHLVIKLDTKQNAVQIQKKLQDFAKIHGISPKWLAPLLKIIPYSVIMPIEMHIHNFKGAVTQEVYATHLAYEIMEKMEWNCSINRTNPNCSRHIGEELLKISSIIQIIKTSWLIGIDNN